jgi:hypothetical protein
MPQTKPNNTSTDPTTVRDPDSADHGKEQDAPHVDEPVWINGVNLTCAFEVPTKSDEVTMGCGFHNPQNDALIEFDKDTLIQTEARDGTGQDRKSRKTVLPTIHFRLL